MQGQPVAEQIMQWMIDVSGLPVSLIGRLYQMASVSETPYMAPEIAVTSADAAGLAVADEWSTGR
ncbi:hypothetical protein D3C81_1880350 [compost metagenome]